MAKAEPRRDEGKNRRSIVGGKKCSLSHTHDIARLHTRKVGSTDVLRLAGRSLARIQLFTVDRYTADDSGECVDGFNGVRKLE